MSLSEKYPELAPNSIQQKLLAVETEAQLLTLRSHYLGKDSILAQENKQLKTIPVDQRREYGQMLQQTNEEITRLFEEAAARLDSQRLAEKLQVEQLDITLPIRENSVGCIHPIQFVRHEIEEIFINMGFQVLDGPEIEDDFHNFTALNIPVDHPARQMQDTFYLPQDVNGVSPVLRTQTSNMQIRGMETAGKNPPYRFISIGKVYRSDSDATHSPMFHQVEGLYVDTEVTLAQMKSCLEDFLQRFFELTEVPMLLRPSYFPFTKPSAEADINYTKVGNGIKIGTGDQWLEIFGCGMVHPNVLQNVGLDPTKYKGFAFGCGIDRLAMLKYGINDMRKLFDSDLRFLRHYGFSFFH